MKKNNNILIIGANDRAAYSVARQYSLNGYIVSICNWENHPIKYSKYVSSFIQLSDVEKDFEKFINELCQLIKNQFFLSIVPINDTAIIICDYIKSRFPEQVFFNINDHEIKKYASNKYALYLKCIELSIPVPKTKYIENLDELADFLKNGFDDEFQFPVIIKPITSKILLNNKIYSNTVKKVTNRIQLIDAIREVIYIVPVMIQETLKGHGIGFNLLAENGKIAESYMHERVHEQWGGGESSYRKTIIGDPYNIIADATNLIESINWSGVCMIEYLIHEGNAYVMEINGRFWGSIELGIFAGKNFPISQIDLAIYNKKIANSVISKEYFSRNLINDVRWAISGLLKHKQFIFFITWFFSLYKTLRRNETIEDSLFRDFKFRANILNKFFSKFFKKIKKVISIKYTKFSEPKELNAFNLKHVAFVCKGNICRSSFAEYYSKLKMSNIQFYSVGTIAQNNRFSPNFAVQAAKKFGVDMNQHLSKNIMDINVDLIDLFLVMDRENYYDLNENYKIDKSKIMFLSPDAEIKDPYGKNLLDYVLTYEIISKEIDSLFKDFC